MPKIVDHEKYRKELADKCMDLFSRKGYGNVTMREISKELGVSTGLLYHYFATKEAIFDFLAAHMSHDDISRVIRQVENKKTTEEIFAIYCKHWLENRTYYKQILLLAIDFYRSYEGPDKEKVKTEYLTFYTTFMAENMGVPHSLAVLLYQHIIGLMYYDLMLPDDENAKEQLDLFFDIITVYLKNQKSREREHTRTAKAR